MAERITRAKAAMTQAVPTLTNILPGISGTANAGLAAVDNLSIKQGLSNGKLPFGQYLAGQLNHPVSAIQSAQTAIADATGVDDGKLLPAGGKISPLLAQLSAHAITSGGKSVSPAPVLQDVPINVSEDPTAVPLPGLATPVSNITQRTDMSQAHIDVNLTASTVMQTSDTGINQVANLRMTTYQGQGDAQPVINSQQTPDAQPTQMPMPADGGGDSAAQLSQADLKRMFSGDNGSELEKLVKQYAQAGHVNTSHVSASMEQKLLSRYTDTRYQPVTDITGSTDSYASGMPQTVQGVDGRPVPVFQLNQPVTQPQWANDFNDRVRWLVSSNIKKAELSLTPRHLGTIDISISVHNDQTHISFNTQNHHSRDLVEASLGRLREMFDQAGLGNVNVDVSQHSDHRETASREYAPDNNGQSPLDGDLVSTVTPAHADRFTPSSLIDLYA